MPLGLCVQFLAVLNVCLGVQARRRETSTPGRNPHAARGVRGLGFQMKASGSRSDKLQGDGRPTSSGCDFIGARVFPMRGPGRFCRPRAAEGPELASSVVSTEGTGRGLGEWNRIHFPRWIRDVSHVALARQRRAFEDRA